MLSMGDNRRNEDSRASKISQSHFRRISVPMPATTRSSTSAGLLPAASTSKNVILSMPDLNFSMEENGLQQNHSQSIQDFERPKVCSLQTSTASSVAMSSTTAEMNLPKWSTSEGKRPIEKERNEPLHKRPCLQAPSVIPLKRSEVDDDKLFKKPPPRFPTMNKPRQALGYLEVEKVHKRNYLLSPDAIGRCNETSETETITKDATQTGINAETLQNYKANYKYPYCDVVDKYEKVLKVGQGTYGEVFKACHKKTQKFVALKKISKSEQDGFLITTLREINILKQLNHENIINLIEVCSTQPSPQNKYRSTFFLVMDFCEHDLAGLLCNPEVKWSLAEIKSVLKQLLNALYYLHSNKLLHRDVKPANVLINKEGTLKLADFGLARAISIPNNNNKAKKLTTPVVTLWYRAPELLLGESSYGFPIDIWSLGCIMAEMWRKKPLFPGTTEQQQLFRIVVICGSMSPEVWPDVKNLPLYNKIKLPPGKMRRVKKTFRFDCQDEDACDLLDKLLILDPSKRIDANTALDHWFFWKDPLPVDLRPMLLRCQHRSMLEHLVRQSQPPPIVQKICQKKPPPPKDEGYVSRVF